MFMKVNILMIRKLVKVHLLKTDVHIQVNLKTTNVMALVLIQIKMTTLIVACGRMIDVMEKV